MVIEREGDSIENHIIILKISIFTSDVHKKLFSESARADLTKDIDPLKFSIGIIPESLLEIVLPEHITKESLLKLQYCHEIENLYVEEDHTLSQLTIGQSQQTLPIQRNFIYFFLLYVISSSAKFNGQNPKVI